MPAPAPNSLKKKCRELPDTPGVYLMKDRLGRIIYVGKAKSLKKRVSSYFQRGRVRAVAQPKIRALISLIADFDTIGVRSEPEALLLEGKLIKQWRPRYNTDFTDDKRFLLVRVDPGEELPRFRLTRLRKEDRSRHFGPFAHSGLLRTTLAQMRRQFGILLADATPQKLPDGTWQLYDDVREEIYGGEHTVTAEAYRARVAAACEFLEGKSREWLAALRAEMRVAADKQAFEQAASLRDIVFALEETLRRTRRFERWRRRSGCPRRRARWSALTSRTSAARLSSPRWCASPTAGRTGTNTGASRSRVSSATTISARWRRWWAAATGGSPTSKSPFPISW
jgi:excinuclease ABC subunit C